MSTNFKHALLTALGVLLVFLLMALVMIGPGGPLFKSLLD